MVILLDMLLVNWLVFIVVGKLFIFLWQSFPLPKFLEEKKTIKKLHECGLCAGVWIYSICALAFGFDLLGVFGFPHIWVISEGATGGSISFVVFIFSIGWKDYFAPDIVI